MTEPCKSCSCSYLPILITMQTILLLTVIMLSGQITDWGQKKYAEALKAEIDTLKEDKEKGTIYFHILPPTTTDDMPFEPVPRRQPEA
jgi:hypothetical protein